MTSISQHEICEKVLLRYFHTRQPSIGGSVPCNKMIKKFVEKTFFAFCPMKNSNGPKYLLYACQELYVNRSVQKIGCHILTMEKVSKYMILGGNLRLSPLLGPSKRESFLESCPATAHSVRRVGRVKVKFR